MSIAVMPESRQPAIEYPLDDRQHAVVQRHRLEHGILREQVVHPAGRVPFRGGSLGLDLQLALQPADRVAQGDDELGLDRAFDDRVAVGVDTGEMIENRGRCLRHHDTIADMELLDNPVWHALTGPQAEFSEGSSLALRYQTDVAVFAALPDEVGPDAWNALAELVGPGRTAMLFRPSAVDGPGRLVDHGDDHAASR